MGITMFVIGMVWSIVSLFQISAQQGENFGEWYSERYDEPTYYLPITLTGFGLIWLITAFLIYVVFYFIRK